MLITDHCSIHTRTLAETTQAVWMKEVDEPTHKDANRVFGQGQ